METLKKAGSAEQAQELSAEVLAKINRFALAPLSAEQVFTFKIGAADDQVDRDMERFTPECLSQLAKLFVGKTVIFDHEWSAGNQTARIYDGETVTENGVCRLLLYAYMLKNEQTQPTIDAINGGILREVSIGCAVGKSTCSICGENFYGCPHRKGEVYDGKPCHVDLSEALDAYELSFVAVPAQRDAGVTKSVKSALRRAIAIDFDGCLCTDLWPQIGEADESVIAAALQEQNAGSALILWTCREGEMLKAAIDWCSERGLIFDAVNENLPERNAAYGNDCRKVSADEYWDDRAVLVSAQKTTDAEKKKDLLRKRLELKNKIINI